MIIVQCYIRENTNPFFSIVQYSFVLHAKENFPNNNNLLTSQPFPD